MNCRKRSNKIYHITSNLFPHYHAKIECSTQLLYSMLFQCNCTQLSRRLQLNASKTELIWFGTRTSLRRLSSADRTLTMDVQPSDVVRDLGVLLDSELTLKHHVNRIASTCFYHAPAQAQAVETSRRSRSHEAANYLLHLQPT